MSFELAFRSRVASIMETLTATALQDLCKLMEETCAALRVEIVHEQNQRTSRMNTNLQAKETSTETDTLTCTENIQIAGIPPELNNNFPVVGQILNEQEANGLWLNGYPTIESGPQSREPAREEPSQPLNQATQEVETWQAPLIKQEEMDDEDIKCQGYGEWTPEAYDANQNDTGESDATENSQASGGADAPAIDTHCENL
ncbi:hypothetical protein UPYG_G00046900 [Umbra pygmaea]|uniref:Uncharacterized protein n=1 Tax=Umbra pygmaea TaxID=75934 RepID=A0ABD0XTX9_UMBPY